jgi:hypothetical protein
VFFIVVEAWALNIIIKLNEGFRNKVVVVVIIITTVIISTTTTTITISVSAFGELWLPVE